MKFLLSKLPLPLTILICAILLVHGPILQFSQYHEFADHSVFMGIAHAGDVFSNVGFALVAIWGMLILWPLRTHQAIHAGRHGYILFMVSLFLTALGSGFYHLAPDNARLIWDRLPIVLACAGLLAAVRSENVPAAKGKAEAIGLAIFAIFSVVWWRVTDLHGAGDLRPYLLLQILPIVLIPLWQISHHAPRADRLAYGAALLVYIVAKFAEIYDHQILTIIGVVSGHTIKHLLATLAAWLIVRRLVQRTQAHRAIH